MRKNSRFQILCAGKDSSKCVVYLFIQIVQAARCPAGLENLALACSPDEVSRQGDFLFRLLEPINGFLILDLHNLDCQNHSFGVAYETLLAAYPLERVREIHVSGGSWAFPP